MRRYSSLTATSLGSFRSSAAHTATHMAEEGELQRGLQPGLPNPVTVLEQHPLHLRVSGCGGTHTSASHTGDPWGGHGGREKLLRSITCWTYSYSLPLSKEGRREGLGPA